MKYRTKLQIIAEILEIVREGARKTHIMYKANLSYKLLCKYLDEVLECGFVRANSDDFYEVAPKGEKFLNLFGNYKKRCEHVRKELKAVNDEKELLEQMYVGFATGGGSKKSRFSGKNSDF